MQTNFDDPLQDLRRQIEEIYTRFQTICAETSTIISDRHMPDAAQQLNGVLAETEQAASTILSAGHAIRALVSAPSIPAETRDQVEAEITRIYEASSFQDISGQRIKKVLRCLQDLEERLGNLFQTAQGSAAVKVAVKQDSLLNGPALQGEAPSQAEVDALFT